MRSTPTYSHSILRYDGPEGKHDFCNCRESELRVISHHSTARYLVRRLYNSLACTPVTLPVVATRISTGLGFMISCQEGALVPKPEWDVTMMMLWVDDALYMHSIQSPQCQCLIRESAVYGCPHFDFYLVS